MPTAAAGLSSIPGSPPELSKIPAGCVYQERCPLAAQICRDERPALRATGQGQQAACHFPPERLGRLGAEPCVVHARRSLSHHEQH
ncbi:oligopeptide/dipeptide ABC transporter ATP-binding protein [Glutamicibacter halophytocola]|uniref:oligopeptide/dipeptide ABC transporter ATP-binding protein n=1 Tax=Glutamicibacter halophytocola TaxID=1933880 RepID=UPI0032192D06